MDLFTALRTTQASTSSDSNPPAKLRSACNRCHSQKLRCIQEPDHATCRRCTRLGISCQYAPRTRRAPKRQATGSAFAHPGSLVDCPSAATLVGTRLSGRDGSEWLSHSLWDINNIDSQGESIPRRRKFNLIHAGISNRSSQLQLSQPVSERF